MTSTTEMIKTLGFQITTSTVHALDNSGEYCAYCSDESAFTDAQIYYVIDGERVMEDGCGGCMLGRMLEISQLGVDAFQVEVEEK